MPRHATVGLVFHALAEPTRQEIIERLSRGPAAVSELARPLDLTLAAVVQHVQVLERAGLVQSQKIGRVRTCQLNTKSLDLLQQWIADRKALWERRLDRLGELLDRSDPN